MTETTPDFEVATVVLTDAAGKALVVRKQGTAKFMNVGGKALPGESWRETAVREVAEEVGLVLDPEQLLDWGTWDAPAANEPDAIVRGHAFRWPHPVPQEGDGAPSPQGEIVEQGFVNPAPLAEVCGNQCVTGSLARVRFAAMFLDHCVPALMAEAGADATQVTVVTPTSQVGPVFQS